MLQFIKFIGFSSSVHAVDTGGADSMRTQRREDFGIHLLLAAVLTLLSGITAIADAGESNSVKPVDPGYAFELSTSSQRFAAEMFNGDLSRFTKLQPQHPAAMQVKLRLAEGSIGSYVYGRSFGLSTAELSGRPPPMSADIEYCLQNGAQFGRNLRDGGQAARDMNNGPTVNRGGRNVEVLRYGDFEFVNVDRDGDNIDLTIVAGGREDHSCVTVRVEINSTNNYFTFGQHTIETGDEIIFNVPSIKNAQTLADPGRPIDVRVRMEKVTDDGNRRTGNGTSFASHYRFQGDEIVRVATFRHEDGVRINETVYTPLGAVREGRRHIAHSAPALQLFLHGQSSHAVSDHSPRNFDHPSIRIGFFAEIAPIATLTLRERDGTQYTSNGTRDFRLRDPHSNRHRLRVTASGPFTPGDQVFLDVNGDHLIDRRETFSFNNDRTVATGTFNILQPLEHAKVFFVASRNHDINPGNYSVHATYDFDYRSYRDLVSNRVTTRINGNWSSLELRQTASATVYATEVFGEGSAETALHARGMSTTLTAQGNTSGGRSRLRFELEAPAVFGEHIRSSHLRAANSRVGVVQRTGTAGSRSVEFTVNARSGNIPAGSTFTFNIPSIRNADALAAAGSTIEVAASMAHGDGKLSGDSIFVDSTVVATSAPGFVFNLTAGDMAVIDPDNPAMLIGDPNVDMDSDGMNDTRALMLGTLVLRRNEGVQHDHDGGDMPVRSVDEVILKVPGLYLNEGDQVFIDLDGDRHVGLGETFATVAENDDDFPAAALTLTGRDATTGADGASVYYVPSGTEDLSATTYTLTADYEFGRADGEAENYQALVIGTESAIMDEADDRVDVDLDSLIEAGLVAAVPGSDEGNDIVIRITNMQSSPVTVYVQGLTEDGTGIGRSVAMIEIMGNGMTSLTPERTDELFCGQAEAACWSGNASFRFFRSPDDNIVVRTHRIDNRDDPDDGNNPTGLADIF